MHLKISLIHERVEEEREQKAPQDENQELEKNICSNEQRVTATMRNTVRTFNWF